jgi:outer membrane protein W
MRRLYSSAGLLALVALLATPSASYAQQSLNLYVGGFIPRGEESRDPDDVLRNNLDFLAFDLGEFHGPTGGAEWLIGLNDFIEAGLGVGVTSQTVPSVYLDYVNSDRSEIEQDLKLRTVPFTATVRFLPLGRRDAFIPYVGAGVGIIRWRYEETGEFVDFSDGAIFRDTFKADGAATGPVILGGARFPLGSVDIGGEVRYQYAKGDLPNDLGFSGTKIDLGGFTYLLTFNIKF